MRYSIQTPVKFICIVLTTAVLFLGCKKEPITSEEWGKRAFAKYTEIKELSANIPCSDKEKTTIQNLQYDCSAQYVAILSSDVTKFEKLKKEYFNFLDRQYAAWADERLIVEPCGDALWAIDQPIRLECKNDKVELITASNLPVDEAKVLLVTTRNQINNLINAQSCANEGSLSYTGLINYQTMTMEFIPFTRKGDIKPLKDLVSLYNKLNINIIDTEKKIGFKHTSVVEKVECVNGKPTIKYKN